jgi:hypothetical protein
VRGAGNPLMDAGNDDGTNLRRILLHHVGHPQAVDDDGERIGLLSPPDFDALHNDLLRYSTRLRYERRMEGHRDMQGYWVPPHQLIERRA